MIMMMDAPLNNFQLKIHDVKDKAWFMMVIIVLHSYHVVILFPDDPSIRCSSQWYSF
jgi:hypothetical protein